MRVAAFPAPSRRARRLQRSPRAGPGRLEPSTARFTRESSMQPQILVPYDFGPASAKALCWANDLQRSLGGLPVHVIHVLNPTPVIATDRVVPALSEDEIAPVRAALREVVEELGIVATTEVLLAASPATGILDAAVRLKADLIVMGTHGRGGLRRVALGSVAEFVVRQARCPVVTLRAQAADENSARAA
ncbi:MAG: universal stress protein [Deltaproteobacteria bacterium]|nr:MAG: universal stress protein [Deltaproteobacteria bacterium]